MDFLITPLGWKNWLLLISALINLVMAIFIFSRGVRKNKINLYFSLLTFACFLWGMSLFLARTMWIEQWFFWASLAYPAALLIAISLFYFTVYFPYKLKNFSLLTNCILIFPSIILSILVFIPKYFIVNAHHDFVYKEHTLYIFQPVYIVYAIYFILLVCFSLYFLFVKYQNIDSRIKRNLLLLFFAILLGLIFGAYFDLFLCYFGNFHYVWLGPIFTFLMNCVVFYLVFFEKEK